MGEESWGTRDSGGSEKRYEGRRVGKDKGTKKLGNEDEDKILLGTHGGMRA